MFATGLLVGISWLVGTTTGPEPATNTREAALEFQGEDSLYGLMQLAAAESSTFRSGFGDGNRVGTSFIIEKIIPAVVRVTAKSSAGSGVVIDPTGVVLTSAHLVGDNKLVTVLVEGRVSLIGMVSRVDMTRDLALVKLPAGTYHSIQLGTEDDISLGAPVYALGYPLNLAGPATVTTGVVSRYLDEPKLKRKVIQTDAAINLGNSGGPIVDARGRVIGIVASILGDSPSKPTTGISFAVSIATIRNYLLVTPYDQIRSIAPSEVPGA